MSLFIKKPLDQLMNQAGDSEKGLKRTLTATNLVALGIGAIIGAGLFVRTAAAASEAAGPAVVISFVIAAVGCAFAGLCYAEFASMIPIAGSAYTYAYATMGEFIAWIIGWALVLEYALGAATVSIAWSEYLNKLLNGAIPYSLSHSPLEGGIINLPALLILAILTAVLIKGTQESASLNAIIVFVKVAIVLLFIVIGWGFINPANYEPFTIPAGTPGHDTFREFGWGGVVGGASIVFFAFIGFDAVSTAAQEAKNPKRDMPIGILGSLVVCTILYILFSHVLTGIANWTEFKTAGKEASVAYAIETYMHGYGWLATAITVAILAGFSSVILVMLLGQSRVFFSMANDGLLPKVFSDLHPKFRTPYKSNIILFFFVGAFAAFIPGSMAGDLTSIGTLFAFAVVCIGVWVLRVKNPELKRPFKTPLVPLVPILGVIVCTALIVYVDSRTQLVAGAWMLIGFVVYFGYSKKNSTLRK
ncbi:amino acid permease [Ohtaekwangia koreensis]|jgi:APA family basic amino acid/polyamine antiporter|uniref:Basic amino acid/polyamine antiporter, APA family n=1 Tax=Ohtaekwangia koreensis TaxID=688867 RepID=A0A1T5LE87_9BACT|nr:amino acid permease [Ohtaekwangia koreensis]SKC74015.1 basic amino acid/polyamine antiporter, APA family [Ohtaekwangia koreensis]